MLIVKLILYKNLNIILKNKIIIYIYFILFNINEVFKYIKKFNLIGVWDWSNPQSPIINLIFQKKYKFIFQKK